MDLNILMLISKLFIPHIASYTKLLALILLNKMVFLKGNRDIWLKLVFHCYISLMYLTITSPMLFLLLLTSLTDYSLLFWTLNLLRKSYSLDHLMFKHLELLVVLAFRISDLTLKTRCNLGPKPIYFLVIHLCLKAISV